MVILKSLRMGIRATGRRRLRAALLAAAALMVIAGCGGSSSPSPAGSGIPRSPAPVPTPNPRYLDPALFPAQDTPIGQASAQLKALWTPYDVTVIPSRHVLDAMPDPPKVINKTNGHLSDSDAEAMAWAEYRENTFIGWLEVHVQPGLNNHLRDHGLFNGAIGNAVRAGQSVTDPGCSLYAAAMAVIPVDPSVVAFEGGKGYPVTSAYALVDTYTAGCAITANGGPLFSTTSNVVIVETGALRHDSVLGAFFFAESGRDCEPGNALAACSVLR